MILDLPPVPGTILNRRHTLFYHHKYRILHFLPDNSRNWKDHCSWLRGRYHRPPSKSISHCHNRLHWPVNVWCIIIIYGSLLSMYVLHRLPDKVPLRHWIRNPLGTTRRMYDCLRSSRSHRWPDPQARRVRNPHGNCTQLHYISIKWELNNWVWINWGLYSPLVPDISIVFHQGLYLRDKSHRSGKSFHNNNSYWDYLLWGILHPLLLQGIARDRIRSLHTPAKKMIFWIT